MVDDLFFLPMVADAWSQPDRRAALARAFRRIEGMAREQRYRNGYRQFLLFMRASGAGTAPGDAEETGASRHGAMDRAARLHILVECDEDIVAEHPLGLARRPLIVGPLLPGHYRVSLDTGRVLWEGRLSEEDLVWSEACPGQPIPVAADTGEPAGHPTRVIPLLDGSMVLRVHAGLEAGTLTVESTQGGGS